MIYSEITGRCGNQLFQYAFARKLSILNDNMPMHLNFHNVETWRKKTGDASFSDQLKNFNTLQYERTVEKENYIDKYGNNNQKIVLKCYFKMLKVVYKLRICSVTEVLLKVLNTFGIYREDNFSKCVPSRTKSDNIFMKGYFENSAYFNDIKENLFEEFTPKYPKKEKNKALYKVIEENESICVSFRVWNEISCEEKSVREVCTPEYYIKAIKKFHELLPEAVFIVFSNDVEWVRKNISFPCKVYFEDGDDEVWEKLRLMYSCKHFIMATSTFTWWAQYLSRNPEKIVISPDKWYANDRPTYLLEDEWIKIKG